MKNSHDFYVIVTPGLEDEVRWELEMKKHFFLSDDGQPSTEEPELADSDRGGFRVRCSLLFGLQLNFFLRTASRVLLRVGSFHVSAFPKLEGELRRLKKTVDSFCPGADFSFKVACSQSKLGNEKRVIETLKRVFPSSSSEAQSQPMSRRVGHLPPQRLFLRIHRDLAELSLDTTGEHLHMRGWRQEHAGAPIRENLAAVMAQLLLKEESPAAISQAEVFDPFVGAGTLLREVLERSEPMIGKRAFKDWNSIPKILKSPLLFANYSHFLQRAIMPSVGALWGVDSSAEALRLSGLYLKDLGARTRTGIRLEQKEWKTPFVGESREMPFAVERWGISNPPYGERKEINLDLKNFFPIISEQHKITRWVLALPRNQDKVFEDRSWRPRWKVMTSNGGIPISITRWDHLRRP